MEGGMIETLKKMMLTGVGVAAMSKEKVEEWAKKIAEESKLAEEEGKKFVNDIVKQSEEAKKSLEEQVNSIVKKTMDKLGLHSKQEIDELKNRIDELEKKLKEGRQ